MIVAGAEGQAGHVIIVGLTEADVALMREGLTKTKNGHPLYGFSQLIVFMGDSDEAMMKILNVKKDCLRRDDLHPNAGSG